MDPPLDASRNQIGQFHHVAHGSVVVEPFVEPGTEIDQRSGVANTHMRAGLPGESGRVTFHTGGWAKRYS